MATPSFARIDQGTLTKGQLRKLETLRRSVGDEIGERAFAAWLATQPKPVVVEKDQDAELIVETLWPLVQDGALEIPRGGYLIRRGRRRVIVEPVRP